MTGGFGTRGACLVRSVGRGLVTSPVTGVVPLATTGICLVLVGAFALLAWNMEEVVRGVGDELRITAFLEEELSPERQAELAAVARAIPGVAEARLVSKQEALE